MIEMRRRWLLGFAAVGLAALGALWFLAPPPPDGQTTAQPPPQPAPGLRWHAGSSQQYKVLVDSSFRMNAAGTGSDRPTRVQLDGVLQWRTLEVDPAQALVGMRMSTVDLRIGGASDAATNRALAEPFRVRFTLQGLPTAFEFPAGLSAEHRGVIENLVRMFQVVIRDAQTWTARESNASGAYEATYARRAPSQVEKTKRSFAASTATTGDAGLDIASNEAIRIDAKHDWLAAMSLDETIKTKGPGGPAIEVTNHATLELQASVAVAAAADTWAFVAAAAPAPVARAEVQMPRLTHEDAKKQLIADLGELNVGGGQIKLVHHMRDLIRADGKLAQTLLDAMKTSELSDKTRGALFLVLELAGSAPAQAALQSVARDTTWPPLDSMRAVVALGAVANPTADTLAALWSMAHGGQSGGDRGQLAGTATLALGGLGNGLSAASDERYSAVRAGLLSGALSGGSDPQARANFIHAVGNTGDASLAREIVPLLKDAAPSVRGAAAQSLGRLGADNVADELMVQFKAEANDVVRAAIAEALVAWTSPSAPAVASVRQAIRTEPDETTRFNMARMLGKNVAAFPENRIALQELLRTEQSKRIRQQLAEALAAGK